MYDRPRRLDFPIPRKEVITKAGTHRAVIYVPSTTDQNKKIPERQFQKRINLVSRAITETFGGDTVQRMSFGSEIRNGRLIAEKIARIEFFTTPKGYKENDYGVGRMVHSLAKKWGQWGISYEDQSPQQARALYFVHPLKKEKLKELM
jgi:hypothetical protein